MANEHRITRLLLILVAGLGANPLYGQVFVAQGTNISADIAADGAIAMDLLGNIWIVPAGGGQAALLVDSLVPSSRPRWSPDGQKILYQSTTAQGDFLRLLDIRSAQTSALSTSEFPDQFATWHPDGERVVFSSARHTSGLDIWETDAETGLSWRLTDTPGDETEPSWSASGRHLIYLHHHDDRWSIMLRRFAKADEVLLESDRPISSLSWRPDGSLLTYLQQHDEQLTLNMLILSEPPLVRQIGANEDFFRFPISWQDRQNFIYTADGVIKSRPFNSRRTKKVPFRAEVGRPASRAPRTGVQRRLAVISPAEDKIVVRGRRLFDGAIPQYRESLDIVIDGGIITSVEPRRDHDDAVVLDLGNVTVLPGFIDAYSGMLPGPQAAVGAQLLAYGVTTIITDANHGDLDRLLWESEATPGPRLLFAGSAADDITTAAESGIVLATLPPGGSTDSGQQQTVRLWQQQGTPVLVESWSIGLSLGADLLLGAGVLPSSPRGIRYQDIQIAVGTGPITLISGLADAGTPGLEGLFRSRQAQQFGHSGLLTRRYSAIPQLANRSSSVVLGSKPNGLPAGLALHAELRALAASGLRGDQVLRASGINAARVFGFDLQIGRITPGALADLVVVAGDPLGDVADALKIVAIVRNGRFYSLVRLLEYAANSTSVE